MNNTYNIKDAASEICRNIVDGRTRFTVKTDIGNILIDVNTDGFGQFETLKFAKFDDVKKMHTRYAMTDCVGYLRIRYDCGTDADGFHLNIIRGLCGLILMICGKMDNPPQALVDALGMCYNQECMDEHFDVDQLSDIYMRTYFGWTVRHVPAVRLAIRTVVEQRVKDAKLFLHEADRIAFKQYGYKVSDPEGYDTFDKRVCGMLRLYENAITDHSKPMLQVVK